MRSRNWPCPAPQRGVSLQVEMMKLEETKLVIQLPPRSPTPPRNDKALLRAYENPLVSLDKAENETLISGGGGLGGWLTSHEMT